MQSDSKIPLVGGTAHGQSVQVDKNAEEVEVDIHSADPPVGTPLFTETYERRHFEGDGFGDGLDCFALKSDDSTEQEELARWTVSQAPDLAQTGKSA